MIKKALIVKREWLNKILSGEKTWEIRGGSTNIRGRIGLAESGSGMIMGEVDLIDSKWISEIEYKNNPEKHCIDIPYHQLPYTTPHRWVIENPVRYEQPVPYTHKKGAIIWVKLDE